LANQELAPIKNYIERCANGEIKVKDYNNARVDKNFFENALSILLLTDPELDRTLVKSDYRRRSYRRQLRVESISGSASRVDQFMVDSTQKIASAEDATVADIPLAVEQITQVPEAEPKRTNFSVLVPANMPIRSAVQWLSAMPNLTPHAGDSVCSGVHRSSRNTPLGCTKIITACIRDWTPTIDLNDGYLKALSLGDTADATGHRCA
jgi:hypothetical protein